MLLVESTVGLLKEGRLTEMVLQDQDLILLSYVTPHGSTRLTDRWLDNPGSINTYAKTRNYLYKVEQQFSATKFSKGPSLRPITKK